jgi:hypothetical protein
MGDSVALVAKSIAQRRFRAVLFAPSNPRLQLSTVFPAGEGGKARQVLSASPLIEKPRRELPGAESVITAPAA